AQRLELYELPDYVPRKGRANDWGFDPAEQRTSTFTGMGQDINVHDQWAVESMGRVQDRTVEHLGATDVGIVAYRKLLRQAIEDAATGAPLPLVVPEAEAQALTGPAAIDTIGPGEAWEDWWRRKERERRAGAPWSRALADA